MLITDSRKYCCACTGKIGAIQTHRTLISNPKKMKKPTLLLTCFAFIFAALLLPSCSLEKRHYRKGYFVQRASGKFQQHGPAIQPIDDQINFAAMAPSETVGFHDTTSTPTLVGTSGCRLKDSSIGEEHLQPVGFDISNVNESVANNNKSVCNSAVKKTSSESLQGKVPGEQKKNRWLKIAACSFIVALAFIPIAISSPFAAVAWLICGAALLVNALIFSIISIGYFKRERKTDRFDWRKAVATVIAFVSGIGLIVYGFWIWLMIVLADL
jgi:hypothetical protein